MIKSYDTMKRLLQRGGSLLCASALVMTLAGAAAAAPATQTVHAELLYGSSITVDDTPICLTDEEGQYARAFTYHGSVYIPLQTAGEWLGGTPEWDGARQILSLASGGEPYYRDEYLEQPAPLSGDELDAFAEQYELDVHNGMDVTLCSGATILLNGKEIQFTDEQGAPVYPMILRGTVYLPVRGVGELCGKEVLWFPQPPELSFEDQPTTLEALERNMGGSPWPILLADVMLYDRLTPEDLEAAEAYLEQVEELFWKIVDTSIAFRDTSDSLTVEQATAALKSIEADADAIRALKRAPAPLNCTIVRYTIDAYAKHIGGYLVERVFLAWLAIDPHAAELKPEQFQRTMTSNLYQLRQSLDTGWALLEAVRSAETA